ncbi:MAG: hypothetical protein HOF19_22430 [Gammaproteobacteria bacterium]|nr:hypothetical protein [Gammaproteobacteria bacterium]MBT5443664.1 hypothetical protein [Gammaproteobacteria bacterium]MBT5789152.1 hypothetical protein [Gammaproteobacteria bacterium]MBT7797347.1 hypothetical protein [Gammaproteobacteria bacterium]
MTHFSSIGGMDYTYLTVALCPGVFSHYSRNVPGIAYDGTASAQHQVVDEVVEKIKHPGGDAIANYDSVKQGDAIIKAGVGAMGSPNALERVFGHLRS